MQNKTSWLLIFTFSPVQGFISSAKKTKDLFAGSYLLSFLTKVVLTKLENHLREDLIKVYPQVEENSDDLYSLMVGNYPNRFVVVLKNKDSKVGREIMENLKSSFHSELLKLAKNTCHLFVEKALENSEKCPSKLENIPYFKGAVEQLITHIKDYFSCFIVAKPVKLCKKGEIYEIENYQREYEITEKLLGGRKTFRSYEGKVDDTTYNGEKYPDGCTTCGERLHLAIDWQKARIEDIAEEEKLCGLCYAKRNLYEVYLKEQLQKEQDEELKLLMTRFPSTHDIALAKEKFEFWKTLNDVYKNKKLLSKFLKQVEDITFFIWDISKLLKEFASEGAKSYGINPFYRKHLEDFIKPILPTKEDWKNFLKREQKNKQDFKGLEEDLKTPWSISVEYLSTSYIVRKIRELEIKDNKTKEDKEKIKTLQKWLNTLSSYFEAIKEVTKKDFEKEFNKPPYFAIIYSDGDNIGKILGGEEGFLREEFSLKFHQEFSKKLSEYALETAKEIENPQNQKVGFAKVIYAGGDDIFAFLHGSEVIRALRICSENYREKLKCLLKEGKATTSAGVVLGHVKVSLKYLHKKTKEAESRAKKLFGRNAFVIKVISRSGEESEFGARYFYTQNGERFNTLDLLEEAVKLYSQNKVSSKLPYTLRDIADRFLTTTSEGKEKIAKTLLKRELNRKISLEGEEKEKFTQKVLKLLELQLKEHGKNLSTENVLKNIAGMFYVARRLSDYIGG